MKKLILITTLLSVTGLAMAQDFIDNALLFSRVRPGGSARIQAIGGAQVSLGGDFSSALSNPAGLGMYNRSEFTISPALNLSSSTSDYFGTTTKDSKSVFNIPGLSLVLRRESGKDSGFLGGSIGISFSRINDFHQNYTVSGDNAQSSIIDYFIEDANNPYGDNIIRDPADMAFGENDFYNLTALAFNTYLIDTLRDAAGLYYDSPLKVFKDNPDDIRHVRQTEVSQRRGTVNQWSIAYGANFSDKFFVGANIGITSLKFKLKQTFEESDYFFELDPDYPSPLNKMLVEETYDISGSGVNLALGLIYRPIEYLQVGASLVTPTYYQLTDAYDARITADWDDFDYYGDGSEILGEVNEGFDQPLISEYNLTTPLRITTGATFITKFGFISGDVEFVNYSKTKYKSDIAADFNFENQDIKAEYKSVVNYRVGGEYRYDKYRARLGYNFMADPYRTEGISKKSINTFSGGLGYRTKAFFVDFAVVYSQSNGTRKPYFVDGPDPVATQKFKNTNFIFTVGFPFQ